MSPFLFLAATVVTVVGFAVWGYQRAKKHREGLMAFALSSGWTYALTEPGLLGRWTGTPFGAGENRRVSNVLRGTAHGRSFVAFEYRYETTSGDGHGGSDRTEHSFAVVAVGLPAYLPRLEVTPESTLTRLGEATGLTHDVDLESEDFNRRYRVTTRDPKFASDVLTPRTMELMLARPAVAMCVEGVDVLSWASGQLSPPDVLMRCSTLNAVIDGVPEFVWKDNGAGTADAALGLPGVIDSGSAGRLDGTPPVEQPRQIASPPMESP